MKTKPQPSRRSKGAGSIHDRNGDLYARVTYTDASGKRRSIERKASNRSHAERLIRELLHDVSQPAQAKEYTFQEVAEQFKAKKLIPAEYTGDTRIKGMRSWKKQLTFLAPLLEFFSHKNLRSITYEQLSDYRQSRFTITKYGSVRSVSMVNRELSLLRSIFNFAKRSGYLEKSPFEMGEGLIALADEVRRDRLITFDEEKRLLEVCAGRRAHLRPIIIAALDTALRKGELLQLRWADIDFNKRTITVRSTTTKTRRARYVPITSRLQQELELLQNLQIDPDAFVFGGIADVKKAFSFACKKAEIADLHFHDLRHCAITRMIQAGLPPGEVMKISGHERFETFARYMNVNTDTIHRASNLLDQLHANSHFTHTMN